MRDNDESLVLTLGFAGRRVLFTGDIEAPAEDRLIGLPEGVLASSILKVPHHGSRTSSTARFVDAVAPQLAVISVGFDNRFGFPHPDVVRRYAARRCLVARTDEDGAVQVRVDADGNVGFQRYREASQRPSPVQITVDSPASEG